MLFKNNKFYEDLVATEKEKENMISECFKILDNESLAPDDEISLRRNEKMKNKEYCDLLKKVAVASLSIIATGGIIAGIVSYNGGSNNNKSVGLKNAESTETDKKSVKETAKEDIKDDTTEETYDIEDEEEIQKKYFLNSDSTEIIVYDGSVRIDRNRVLDVEEEGNISETCRYNLVVRDSGKKDIVDNVSRSSFYYSGAGVDFWSYGKYILYFDDEGLKKLDTDTYKTEYVAKGSKYAKLKGKGTCVLFCADDKKVYFSISAIKQVSGSYDSEEWDSVEYYMFECDSKDKKLKFIGNKGYIGEIHDGYILTLELPGYKYNYGHPYETRVYVEEIKNGEIKTVSCLGDRVEVSFNYYEGDGIPYAFSQKNPDLLYYIDHKKELESGKTDYSEFTIMSYDFKTNEKSEVVTISSSMVGSGITKRLNVSEVTDDYCKFIEDNTRDNDNAYKYMFETGKIKTIREAEY